jgi:hypothetical protein
MQRAFENVMANFSDVGIYEVEQVKVECNKAFA